MIKKHKHDIIVLLALIGFGVSLFLSITHYMGLTVPCNVTHGCEIVLSSKYSMLLGLPLSVWGVVYFTGVIVAALLANSYVFFKKALTVMLSIGALGALVLLSIQFFVLKKVCQYCLATDIINILLFIWDLNVEHSEA